MKKILLLALSLCLVSTGLFGQSLKSPDEFLGYELGTRFTPHHKVVAYYEYVAAQLSNVKTERYGQTNELRPLMVAYLSSQENMDNWEQIRTDNLKRTHLMDGDPVGPKKGIVWLSYNVHGNEANSTETSMKTLYELARPDNSEAKAWLENTVVIMDPCINPDGRDRYANWINQVIGTTPNPSLDAKEHQEPWPGGRPNHYLFDLNRDWAWQKQVESQQRMKLYNTIMPHVHVDFHEQGFNSPYYFAPAAEPIHEQVTDWQREFQDMIGRNHAKYFDENSWLFFTKESFDILYPSYGDSYPMYNGAIGMTYEQGGHSMGGVAVETEEGDTLTLADRIAHHHTTGMSTVEMAAKNSERMVDEFATYFDNAVNNPKAKYKTYVIRGTNHPDKLKQLEQFLKTHQIAYGTGSTKKGFSAFDFKTGENGSVNIENGDILISANQPKAVLVQAFFEPKTYASINDTYDITAWSVPYMLGLEAYATEMEIPVSEGEFLQHERQVEVSGTPAAYLAKWETLQDAKFLGDLLEADIKLRFAVEEFTVAGRTYAPGTLIITRKGNRHMGSKFDEIVKGKAAELGRDLYATPTTFVDGGKDFGSNNVPFMHKPKIAVLRGDGVSSLAFGEFWYFMEQELGYPITMIDTDAIGRTDMSNYNVLVLPSGSYGRAFNESQMNDLKSWIRGGGKVLAFERAIGSFAGKDGFQLKRKTSDDKKSDEEKEADALTPYADRGDKYEDFRLPGAIFKLKVDNTHPMGFGYEDTYFTIKNNSTPYEYLPNGWNVGIIESAESHVAGVAGEKVKENLGKSVVFGVENMGGGAVIYFADNPLFRAFWENGKMFVANALFMVGQ
ncbi:M14 family metallopeptidase [Roseivirga pacifica]|uniref:M14 family metallopeptidase n=1 Tax=Roseivirga pacifica TaxID=1267423 RepID=UPI003BAD6C78